ncbi:VCBS repeat protein [Maribacter vaceletii]|uniref:VCBS repeat protein n=1 Tax=Maribacter vaceletii TaxID=1206816 RepID=A0A495DTU8_9FLAO|nr:FG-GAP-like repeat-containing protein [Maribacter vaceletii]RKR07063.1 VCBS repeat protein [Maribacter vaceletii]
MARNKRFSLIVRTLKASFTIFAFLFFAKTYSQTTFTESAAAYGLNLGQNKDGGHAWSDFNGDGLLDVLVLENNNSASVKSFLMRQGPAGTFTNVQASLAPGMLGDYAERQAAWGDINGDGRPDFMINSSGNSTARQAIQIFIQNTDGTFGDGAGGYTPITVGRSGATINIPSVNSEGTGFFDFEGDGDLDIFFDNHNFGIELLRNNYIDHTTHTVVNPAAASLFTHITPGSGNGVVEYGLNQFATDGDYGSAADVNDDGWVDIFMRKRDENDFFLNQGGTFTNGANLGQANNSNKGANGLWDLDNDGDLDAVWTENGLTQIFRNDGPGVWTPLGAVTFPGLPQPSNTNAGNSSNDIDGLTAGDVDNDGDIDILFIGDGAGNASNRRSYLFINQLNSPTPAPGVIGSGAAMSFTLDAEFFNTRDGEGATMIDIDDDGDLDIYMNINGAANELYINNLPAANRNNHLLIDVSEDRGADGNTGGLPPRVAIGTNVLIRDCAGNIVSGLRQVNGVYGHGTQSPEEVHFGLPLGENETYIIEVRYPNFYDASDPNGYSRLISTIIAQPSTISGTNHYDLSTTDAEILENENPPDAENDLVVVPQGNSVSVQINLFDNDTEPDGENFFIESIVQPAIGSVVIDDANAGLVTYTYSAGTPFTGTSFDYTITDSTVSVCPALGKSDTATVYIEEPCTDLSGIDTDGDGINDICDVDDDNDGILDVDECPPLPGVVEPQADALDWIKGNHRIFVIGNNTNANGYLESGFQKEAYHRQLGLTVLNGNNDFSSTASGDGSGVSSVVTFSNGTMSFSTSYITTNRNEFRRTTGGAFKSGNSGDAVFVEPEQGGVAGDFYTVDIDFTTPVTAFSFDMVDILDTIIGDDPVLSYAVYADGVLIAYIKDTIIGDDATGPVTVFDGADFPRGDVVAGQNRETNFGFITDTPVNNVEIRYEILTESITSTARDPHGLDNFAFSTDTPCTNSKNTDSDGDGCSDADEAYLGLVPNADSDNNGTYGSGTPTVNSNGQVNGAAYNTTNTYYLDGSVNACNDVDNDAIPDDADLDNDNDGILDSEECLNSEGLVTNGDFSDWIYYNSWTRSGQQWGINADRAYFPNWSNGTATFYQTINVSANTENTITFDVGADTNTYNNQVTFNVLIDGTTMLSETSNQIVATNGGQSQNGNATLNMTSRTFTFTPTTSTVTLSFQGVSTSGNHDRLYVDNVVLKTGCVDFDGDGVPNYLDLDSDNDGIYDVIEAGHDIGHTNGRLSGPYGTDGIANSVQNSGQENSGNVNYTVLDSDNDSNKDFIEIDSDNDGCNDVIEANFTESGTNAGELQGTGYNATTGIVTGNANGYTTPADDNSDSQYDYKVPGLPNAIDTQPQDQNVAEGSNATFSVTTSATGNTYQWQVSTNDGGSYANISGATGISYTVTSVTNAQDNNLYRVIITNASFSCSSITSNSALLTIAPDFDNDGIIDTDDLDDDNDGILDEVEANNCNASNPQVDVVIFNEDFGTANGSRATTPYTNYLFEDGSGSAGADSNLQDGEYTIFEDITATASWANSIWQTQGDHTTGSDRMAIFNANNTPGLEFYRRFLVQVTQNVPLNISLWAMNLDTNISGNNGRTEPDITVLIQQSGTTVYSFNTGAIAREPNGATNAWKNFTGSFTPTSNATLELVLINNAPGGGGNDLAIDDIQITQAFCDSNGDGIPNAYEADSDGDGCNDSDEAYGDVNADSDNNGMYGSGTPSVNPDGTVIGASYQTPEDADANTYYDFLEAGLAPAITTEPTDENACPGGGTSFTVVATNSNEYQWQQRISNTWTNITDTGIHSGTDTATLTITNAALSDNNNLYRVLVYNAAYVCDNETSNQVRLRVRQPNVNAGANQTICDGESTTLTATTTGGSGTGYTYLWSTGETTPTITVTPAGNTNNNVNVDYTVTVTDSNSCTDTDTVRVIVEPTPTITVSSAPSCTFRLFQPTTYTFEVTVSAGTVTATAGTVTNPSGNVWRIADVPDGTDVTVTATQGNCSRDLVVAAPNCVCPTVDAPTSGGDEEFCVGSPIPQITANPTAGQETIDWYTAASGGTLLQSGSTSYQPTAAGTYYAESRNTTTGCVSATRTAVTVTQNALPNASAGANQTICDGESATLTASASGGSGSGYTYLWSTGATTPSITVTPAGNPNSNTTYIYTVTVTDSNGCENSDSANVIVYSNPTATVTTTDTSCGIDNGVIRFSFPDHPNRSGIAFSIDNQASYSNTADANGTYDFTNLAAGTYNLWVRWGNSSCPVSLGSYQINTIPVVSYSTQPTNQTVFAGDNGVFTSSVSNADTYQWQVSVDGVSYTNVTNGTEYSGAQTASLTVLNVEKNKDGFYYRVLASNSGTTCSAITSNAALLTVRVKTVITNRRITHRVRKN